MLAFQLSTIRKTPGLFASCKTSIEVFRGSFVAASKVGLKASRKASLLAGSIVIVMWTEMEGLLSMAILCTGSGEYVDNKDDHVMTYGLTGKILKYQLILWKAIYTNQRLKVALSTSLVIPRTRRYRSRTELWSSARHAASRYITPPNSSDPAIWHNTDPTLLKSLGSGGTHSYASMHQNSLARIGGATKVYCITYLQHAIWLFRTPNGAPKVALLIWYVWHGNQSFVTTIKPILAQPLVRTPL